jgi:CheY-like chemotaxis protein
MSKLRRVMCVEDDADIRLILELSLGTVGGLDVLTCNGGREALARVDDFRPDLVLLDVMMPELTGPQTLVALRERPVMHGVPVVFMTAKALPEELEALLDCGVTGVIVKPFDPMTLPQNLQPYWEHGRGRPVP